VTAHTESTTRSLSNPASALASTTGTTLADWGAAVGRGLFAAAATSSAMAGVQATDNTATQAWGQAWNPQHFTSSAYTWDNSRFHALHVAMKSPAVHQFLLQTPAADPWALTAIYDMTLRAFNVQPSPEMDFEVWNDDETNALELCLNVRTHGMNLDELMAREIQLREDIEALPRLEAAKRYLTLAIV